MGLTSRIRATTAAGAGILASGLAVTLRGIYRDDLARSLGGIGMVGGALTVIALAAIRKWILDTSEDRRVLAAARRQADGERTRYFAERAAMVNEQCRLTQSMAAERARVTAMLVAEREAMQTALEKERLQISQKAFREGVMMERAGMLEPDVPVIPHNLIQFPKQTPGAEPQRERSREHGVVGP